MSEIRRILLVCDTGRHHAANVREHLNALTRLSRHDVHVLDPIARPDLAASVDLDPFDAVVVHYTIIVTLENYLPRPLAEAIATFDGLKVQFIQDEYRWIDAITARIRELGIRLLFSLVPPEEVPKVYGERVPETTVVTTLAGYVPDGLAGRPVPPLARRPIEVGYRGRSVPFWLGRLGQEKVEIARGFLARARPAGLRCDIAWGESDRMYGERWYRFMAACRATLGTESGASIADFDGSLERRVAEYLKEHPAAAFEDVEREVLAPYEGNVVINVISPRMFEAAALRTAMVLYPGEYSGVIEPERHYVPLEKDFSNFAEVARRLRDVPELEAMVERAYADLVASGRYSLAAFVREFDDLVAAQSEPRGRGAPAPARRRVPLPRPTRTGAMIKAYRAAMTAASVRAVSRQVRLRRLLREYARDARARRSVDPGRLWQDVVRVAALLDAHERGADGAGTPFRIVPHFDENARRLAFASRALSGPDGAAPDPELDAARSALASGSVDEIVWNHAAVGDSIALPLVAWVHSAIPVGYHVIVGAHSFGGLVRLADHLPRSVSACFEPLLEPAGTA